MQRSARLSDCTRTASVVCIYSVNIIVVYFNCSPWIRKRRRRNAALPCRKSCRKRRRSSWSTSKGFFTASNWRKTTGCWPVSILTLHALTQLMHLLREESGASVWVSLNFKNSSAIKDQNICCSQMNIQQLQEGKLIKVYNKACVWDAVFMCFTSKDKFTFNSI